MPDTIEKPIRRATDKIARRVCDPSLSNCEYISSEYAAVMHEEIEAIKRKLVMLDTSFLRDDLGAIDYATHRTDHLDIRRSKSIISEYKVSGTKVIIGIVLTFLVGILSSGFISKMSETLIK